MKISTVTHRDGYCYVATLPSHVPSGDHVDDVDGSTARLFEDDVEIGPGHQLHDVIQATGRGAFSHWNDTLYFSSSDGSDPTRNGRSYALVFDRSDTGHGRLLKAAANLDVTGLDDEQRFSWGERLFGAFVPEVHIGERSRSAFREVEFRRDLDRFGPGNHRSYDRKFAMKELFKWALSLDGDVAECGVYQGASAYLLARHIAGSAPEKRLHLFDSFEGVSQPVTERDGTHWTKGDLACGLDTVMMNLAAFAKHISCYQGWIPERFDEVSERTFCFVHIDVDLFEPTRDALAFFMPRIVGGGLIVCDDYGFETCPGARAAMDEAAMAAGLPVVHLPTGQGILMQRPLMPQAV